MKTMFAESAIEICHVSLSGVMIFPGMSLPLTLTAENHLRVFEQAWLSNQRLLLTIQDGESNQASVGCLVEIQTFHFQENHNATVLLHGVSRNRVTYNQKTIQIGEELQDIYNSSQQTERLARREQLLRSFLAKFPVFAENQLLQPALECELPFGTLCDVLAASCRLSAEEYDQVLAAINVDQRCDLLMEILLRKTKSESEFPPVFSMN